MSFFPLYIEEDGRFSIYKRDKFFIKPRNCREVRVRTESYIFRKSILNRLSDKKISILTENEKEVFDAESYTLLKDIDSQ